MRHKQSVAILVQIPKKMRQTAESFAAFESQKAIVRGPKCHADIRKFTSFRILPVAEKATAVVVAIHRGKF